VLLARVEEELGAVGRVDERPRGLQILLEERVALLGVHLHGNPLGPTVPELRDR
jgi:hypothetical protein